MKKKPVKMIGWESRDDCWTSIGSLDIVREQIFKGYLDIREARVIRLERAQKKRFVAVVVRVIGVTTTRRYGGYGICPAGMLGFIWR